VADFSKITGTDNSNPKFVFVVHDEFVVLNKKLKLNDI
jgi:hypothetical protein